MITVSLKQIFRTPAKTTLFISLIAGVTALVVFASVFLIQTNQRIDAVERQFTTVGFVHQPPVSSEWEVVSDGPCRRYESRIDVYDEIIPVECLDFDGADYILPPESRPYYYAFLPDYAPSTGWRSRVKIVEFTPLEEASSDGLQEVEVGKILYNAMSMEESGELKTGQLKTGSRVLFCQEKLMQKIPLEVGRTYIASIGPDECGQHLGSDRWDYYVEKGYNCNKHPDYLFEYTVYPAPFSTQYGIEDDDNMLLAEESVRNGEQSIGVRYFQWEASDQLYDSKFPRIQEVGSNFYEKGQPGEIWETWAQLHETVQNWIRVLPTNGLQLLPAFHDRNILIKSGREISVEEFESGARVCMVSWDFANKNYLDVGETIHLPLNISVYSYLPNRKETLTHSSDGRSTWQRGFSPLNAEGEVYEPFWEDTYKIVGIYKHMYLDSTYGWYDVCGETELAQDMVIIPAHSVKADDSQNIAHMGAMNRWTTSFQIPNGSISEFDATLRAAVPEAGSLEITYEDNGYEKIMISLRAARTSSLVLLIIGATAGMIVITLLLYFFVVKEKKRTAIERSLGMKKSGCRLSILIGILALTVIGSGLGSMISAQFVNSSKSSQSSISTEDISGEASREYEGYSTKFSLWVSENQEENMPEEESYVPQTALFFIVPLCIIGIVCIFSLIIINQNMKIEPILLLSTKGE